MLVSRELLTLNAANSTIFIRQYVLTSIQLESNWNYSRKGHHSQSESVWGVKPEGKWCKWAGWDDWCPRRLRQQWWQESYLVVVTLVPAFADPKLRIRGGGEGGGPQDPEIRGMGRFKKNFFSALQATVRSKSKGAGAPDPLPWICHWPVKTFVCRQVKGPSRYHDFF